MLACCCHLCALACAFCLLNKFSPYNFCPRSALFRLFSLAISFSARVFLLIVAHRLYITLPISIFIAFSSTFHFFAVFTLGLHTCKHTVGRARACTRKYSESERTHTHTQTSTIQITNWIYFLVHSIEKNMANLLHNSYVWLCASACSVL